MSEPLTAKQRENYLQDDNTGFLRCPFCGDEDLDFSSMQTDSNCAWRDVHCQTCGRGWQDQYTLTNVQSYDDDGNLQRLVEERRVNLSFCAQGHITQCMVFTEPQFFEMDAETIERMLDCGQLLVTCQDEGHILLMPSMEKVGYLEDTEPQLEYDDFEVN
jgi:hypothetical protein